MNVIELVKQIITECPLIAEFTNNIHVDFTEDTPTNFGLSSTGDRLIKDDILGNQTRQHNFVLYAVNQSFNDYDRLANSTFLLDFAYWLEHSAIKQTVTSVVDGYGTSFPDGEVPDDDKYPIHSGLKGELIKMSSANAMIYSIPDGNLNNGVTYQIQIYAQYTIESEEI